MTKIATVFGGSGFVGRYVVRRLANAGWRVRVGVRRPNEAIFVQVYGFPGQVMPILANVRYDDSAGEAIAGSSAVVNCVGILNQIGKQRFDSIHFEAAERLARLSAAQGVERFVHISSLGSSDSDESFYSRSKAKGEKAVMERFNPAVILRPSVIFGNEDEFFNKFAAMARVSPLLPLPGASTRFQPVFVDDVARAVEKAVVDGVEPGIYDLGGPEVLTLKELIDRMLATIRRKRLVLPVPPAFFSPVAWLFDMCQFVSGGLIANNLITRDQLKQLGKDNVVSDSQLTFADLGIKPTALAGKLEKYLYSYRPAGQYTAIHESSDLMQ